MAIVPDSRVVLALLGVLTAFGAGTAEASAAVKMKSANAVDSDADGAVDGFDVNFTAKLRGKARTGKVPFRVSGFRVTAMGKARGRRVRVRVAEGRNCDVGAKPRITFRGGQLTDSRRRKLRRSRIDLGRKDRRSPRLTCAVTGDRDADGHIDSITLTWSRPVRSPATSGGGQFGVDRYSIASVAAARGRYVTLRLKEKSAFDTGEVPAVFYRKPKQRSRGVRATARRRGVAASTTYNDTRDKAVARLQSARTEDANLNGFVDGVVTRFSESVKADPSAIAVAGARVTSVTRRGRDFAAKLAEGPLRSSARPDVSFGTASKVVRDLAGNVAPRTSVRAADGAAPVIVAARTLDRRGIGGRLDTLSLTWSEGVSHTPDSDGSYPLGVTGYSIASAEGTTGAVMELLLNEGSTPDSGARPPVGYTRGTGTPVRDTSGNEAASHVFAGAADAIAPRLLSARTLDIDADGRLDRVRFEFTEPIGSPQRACSGGCGFSVGSLTEGTALAGAGTAVEVTVAEGALNGGLKPGSSYSPTSGGAVRDASGNAALASGVTAADGAPPVALDAYTADSDSDARIDRVNVTFSEALSYPGDSTGSTSFTATGYTVLSAGAASGNTLTLNLEPKDDPDTGSAPAVGYDGLGGVRLFDANGVEHASRSWPSLTRDAVAPQFVDARTADLNAGGSDEAGKVDAVELVYSEELTGTADVNDFQVDGAAPASIAFEPDSVKLRVAEGSSYNTDITLPVSYTPGDLSDVAEGPGDTSDPAPAASTTAVDGASPVIVEAETGDTGTPNGTVDRVSVKFSEPVTYVPGLPAISLTSPAMTVSGITADGPSDLTLAVAEGASPDGGAKPQVTVIDPTRVSDAAGNNTSGDAFAGTTDNVAPVLVSARLGEAASGRCGTAPVNGRVDCVRATWSEPVVQPTVFSALSLSTFTIDGMLDSEADSPDVDASFTEGSTANRDTSSQLTYTGGGAGEVFDIAGLPSFSPRTVTAGSVCKDIKDEPNDSQDPANPLLSAEQTTEKLCSADSDWFRVAPSGGQLNVRIDPNTAIAPVVSLHEADGTQVAFQPATTPGTVRILSASGLSDPHYYLHVRAAPPQEGAYCVDRLHAPGDNECDDEDATPQ
jgi:hypothetical protein